MGVFSNFLISFGQIPRVTLNINVGFGPPNLPHGFATACAGINVYTIRYQVAKDLRCGLHAAGGPQDHRRRTEQ